MWRNLRGTATESSDTLAQGRARGAAWQAYLQDQIADLETLLGENPDAAALPHTAFSDLPAGPNPVSKGLVILEEDS